MTDQNENTKTDQQITESETYYKPSQSELLEILAGHKITKAKLQKLHAAFMKAAENFTASKIQQQNENLSVSIQRVKEAGKEREKAFIELSLYQYEKLYTPLQEAYPDLPQQTVLLFIDDFIFSPNDSILLPTYGKRPENKDELLQAIINGLSAFVAKKLTAPASIALELANMDERKWLPNINTVMPNIFSLITDKRSTIVFNSFTENDTKNLRMERQGSKKEITGIVSINYDDLPENISYKKLTPYERIVHDAICTLYAAGNNCITYQMIYRTMNGDNEARLSQGNLNEIETAVNKLLYTQVIIDAKDERDAYKQWGIDYWKYDGHIIQGERLSGKLNGQIVYAYIKIGREPILLTFAKQKNQISTIDNRLLRTPGRGSKQKDLLRDYLLRRIEAMKHSTKLSYIILYSSIFTSLGIDLTSAEDRRQRTRIKDYTNMILTFWKNESYISDYKTSQNGDKLSITLPKSCV